MTETDTLRGGKAKPKSKRVRLAETLRKEIGPLLRSYGFDNPPKSWPREWILATRLHCWTRQREGFTDEIYIAWPSRGAPVFRINYLTSQKERLHPAGDLDRMYPALRLYAWRLRLFGGRVDLAWARIGGFRSIEGSVSLALRRLEELNTYLVTGRPRPHVEVLKTWAPSVSPKTADLPETVFWWRELHPLGADAPSQAQGAAAQAAARPRA